jgi:hypothetical protein
MEFLEKISDYLPFSPFTSTKINRLTGTSDNGTDDVPENEEDLEEPILFI